MSAYGSGFIIILNYANASTEPSTSHKIITQNGLDILTELGDPLLIEDNPLQILTQSGFDLLTENGLQILYSTSP